VRGLVFFIIFTLLYNNLSYIGCMTSQKYISDFINKPNQPRYLIQQVVNKNPYLFGDRIKSYYNKKVWVIKRVFPTKGEASYWTTYKSAINFLKWAGASWTRA